jgi:hypothetical protein
MTTVSVCHDHSKIGRHSVDRPRIGRLRHSFARTWHRTSGRSARCSAGSAVRIGYIRCGRSSTRDSSSKYRLNGRLKRTRVGAPRPEWRQGFVLPNSSGKLAMLAVICRASSRVINLVAARRPGSKKVHCWSIPGSVSLLVVPWIYYPIRWRRNADGFLPPGDFRSRTAEALRMEWELRYIADKRSAERQRR